MEQTIYEKRHHELMMPVVRVNAKQAIGSGTVIYSGKNKEGEYSSYVLTNFHVIEKNVELKDQWSSVLQRNVKRDIKSIADVDFFRYRWASRGIGATTIQADIVAYDRDEDLALLKLRDGSQVEAVAKLYPRGEEHLLRATMSVYCVGAGLGGYPVITEGMLSQFGEIIENREFWLECLPAGELVSLNPRGTVPIESVRAGDKCYGWRPTGGKKPQIAPVPVKFAGRVGIKPIIKLETRHRTLRCSADHPVLVYDRPVWSLFGLHKRHTPVVQGRLKQDHMRWVPAGEVQLGQEIIIATRLPVGSGLPSSEFVDWAEFIGFFAGDGCVLRKSHHNGRMYLQGIHLATETDALTQHYEMELKRLFSKGKKYNRGVVVWNSNLAKIIASWPLGQYSRDRHLPEFVFRWPEEARRALLRGYLDSDGHVGLNSGVRGKSATVRFSCRSKRLIQDLWHICLTLGIQVSAIRPDKRGNWRFTSQDKAWQAIGSHDPEKSRRLQFLRVNYRLACKRGIAADRVIKVAQTGLVEPVYDVSAEGSFVAGGIVTHNSAAAIFGNSGGALFLADTHLLIGVPSRIAVTWGQAIPHLMYAIPITRIYQFVEDQRCRFIYDSQYTEESEIEERERMRESADRRQLLEGEPPAEKKSEWRAG